MVFGDGLSCVPRKLGAVHLAACMVLVGCSESPDYVETEEFPVEEAALDIEESPSPEPVAVCDNPPENGAVLSRRKAKGRGPHSVRVVNGASGNTIVNIRDWETNKLVLSFFVQESQTATIDDVPDGSYRVQYAFGETLGEDCRSFVLINGASQDRDRIEFTPGSAMRLTYELLPQTDGNFTGQPIDPRDFASR